MSSPTLKECASSLKIKQQKRYLLSYKAWIWAAYDFSDEEAKIWKFCGRFTSVEEYNRFKDEFEKAKEHNKLQENKESNDSKEKEQKTEAEKTEQ